MLLFAVIGAMLLLTSEVPLTVDGKCDGNVFMQLSGSSGSFSTTNYPSNFEQDEICKWNISVPSGNIVKLSFSDFAVGTHDPDTCDQLRANVVTVSNTANDVAGILELCGSKIPDPLFSSDTTMTVQFVSASVDLTKGFNATYEAIPAGDICPNQKTLGEATGTLMSPYHPRRYPGDSSCSWTITAPTAAYMELNFTSFNVEACGVDCNCDRVDVYDGTSSASKHIGRYCGDDFTEAKAPIVPLYSTQKSLTVVFYSESGKLNGQHHTGFEAVWKESDFTPTVCENPEELGGTSGTFNSPRYQDGTYVHGQSCTWLITVAAGSRIKLAFVKFELQEAELCLKDRVEIYDGKDANAPILKKYCSRFQEAPVVSSGRYMFVKFTSDRSISYAGFDARYQVTNDPPSSTIAPGNTLPTTTSDGNTLPPTTSDAFPLKCYVCSDCGDKNGDEKTCSSVYDQCSIAYMKANGKETIARSCATKASCDADKKNCDTKKASSDVECEAACCDSDLCNSGAAPSFSVLLVSLSSLSAVVLFCK